MKCYRFTFRIIATVHWFIDIFEVFVLYFQLAKTSRSLQHMILQLVYPAMAHKLYSERVHC